MSEKNTWLYRHENTWKKKKNVCMFMHFFFGLHIPFLSEEEEWQFRLEKNGPWTFGSQVSAPVRAEQSRAELCWNLSLLMFESRNQLALTHQLLCTTSWLLLHSFCMDPCSNQFRFHTTMSILSTPKKHLLPFKQSKHFHQRNWFT